jgi:UDP-glucose 4-epimerase
MQISITGGTGCLGHPLVETLIEDGAYTKLLIQPNDPLVPSYNKAENIIGDLNSAEALDLLTKDCDSVFHLAGMVHTVPRTKEEENAFYQVNVEGTRKLLTAARKNKVRRIVFYSTVATYGKDADLHGDELSSCNPQTAYAKSKLQAEELVLDSFKNGGPQGVVLRFPIVYGPLDRGNVARLIKFVHNKYFFYFGDGNCLKSMISSRNAAEVAIKAAFEPKAANEVFCVTDGIDYKLRELIEAICRSLNSNWRPPHIPLPVAKMTGRMGDLLEKLLHTSCPINTANVGKLSNSLTFSCDKAKRILGYKPVEALDEGILREVVWLKKKRGWK